MDPIPIATFEVSGTVYRDKSDERLAGAIVKAQSEGQPARFVSTDDDGDFSFPDLEQGTWTLTALHEQRRASQAQTIEVNEKKPGIEFRLNRLMETADDTAGRNLFRLLSAGLIAVALLYVVLHFLFPPASEPISPALQPLITSALQEVETADNLSTGAALTTTLSEISSTLDDLLTNTIALSNEEMQVLDTARGLVTRAEMSIADNDKAAARVQLETLRGLVEMPRAGNFFWLQEPWRFLEVLFWGLAGILARLIMSVGSYLRWGRFYREGLPMHMAQLVTIPLLVLVVVLLLSMVTIQLTLAGGTEVSLDLRDPRLLAAASFLIAIGPWEVWGFIRDASSRILGQGNTQQGANNPQGGNG